MEGRILVDFKPSDCEADGPSVTVKTLRNGNVTVGLPEGVTVVRKEHCPRERNSRVGVAPANGPQAAGGSYSLGLNADRGSPRPIIHCLRGEPRQQVGRWLGNHSLRDVVYCNICFLTLLKLIVRFARVVCRQSPETQKLGGPWRVFNGSECSGAWRAGQWCGH